MMPIRRSSLFILILFMFSGSPAREPFAIVPVNTCSYGSYNSTPMVVSGSDGEVLIAWTSYRQGNQYQNIYVQKLDATGAFQWEPDGTPIAPVSGGQEFFEVISDGYGGMIIVWEDNRFGKANPKIYVQRINLRGEPLWGVEGSRLCMDPGPQHKPRIVSDNAGGFFICWEDQRGGANETDIYAQHIDLGGRFLWPSDGLPVVTHKGVQKNVRITADNDHMLYLVWEDFRNGRYWNLFAQKVDAYGGYFWPAGGLDVFAGVEENHLNASLVPDGNGGILFVYQKWSEFSRGYDIFRGRLLSNATLQYHYSTCHSIDDQVNPVIIRRGLNALLCWEDRRYGDWDIYCQLIRINDGILEWDPNGMSVCRADGEDRNPKVISSVVTNDQVFIWQRKTGEQTSIYIQKLDNLGAKVWDDAGMRLSGSQGPELEGSAAYDSEGNIWCAWADGRESSGQYCYVQKINWNGVKLFKSDGNKLAAPHKTPWPAIETPRMITTPNGDFILAWTDYRNGYNNADIYIQRFTWDGKERWRMGGIPLCMAPGEQTAPVIVDDGVGGVIVIWNDLRNGTDENLYAQRVNMYGKTQWLPNGVVVCDAPRSQGQVRAVTDGREGVVLCWSDSRSVATTSFDLYIQRVSFDGECLWGDNGKPFARFDGLQSSPSIAPDGDGGAFISWMDNRDGFSNIYVQHINHYGIYEWEYGGRVLARSDYNQRSPQLLVNFEKDVCLVWEDGREGDGNEKIYMQSMTPMGTRVWGMEGQPLCTLPGRQTKASIVADEVGRMWVAWLDERTRFYDGHRLFIQKLDLGGRSLWEPGGVPVGRGLEENNDYKLVLNPKGYAILAWSRKKPDGSREVLRQKMHPDGYGKLQDDGATTWHSGLDQYHPDLAVNAEGKVILCWVEKDKSTGACSLKCMDVHEE